MAEIGYFLSSEEHGPHALLDQAKLAEQAGLRAVWISDHYHPWLDSQGQSAFVWSVIGGIGATTELRVTTAVTCPTMRIHPAVLAQAAATSAVMLPGRFAFGVGSGEALNEHIVGKHWPPADVRLEMLEEAIEVMRDLWRGEQTSHRGRHYTVENATIYTLPTAPPPVIMSAFGRKATDVAARVADGFASTRPDPDLLRRYREHGGRGPAMAGVKVCWGTDEEACRKLAHELWRSSSVPGQLSQDLPTPSHFEQASELVTPEQVAEKIPCGPDTEKIAQTIQKYIDAGFDEVYVSQIGTEQRAFLEVLRRDIEPQLSSLSGG
jgi:G6PDH family F420-dependent oxidoreductase